MAEQRKANLAALEELRRGNDSLRAELDELAKRVNQLDGPVERAAPPHLHAVD